MKTYFTSKELPHQWAHQLAPRGECPGHKTFDGVSYYSYDTEIARIITRGKRKAYLLNTTSYSITTSSHQNGVRVAVPHDAVVFEIGGIGMGCSLTFGCDRQLGSKLFDYAIEQASKAAAKLPRARKQWNKDHLAGLQSCWFGQAESVSAFFGLRRKVNNKAVARLVDRIAADEKRKAREAKERQERLAKENAELVEQWCAGANVRFPYSIDRCYLRAVLKDAEKFAGVGHPDTLETSKGVMVPLREAKRAYKFALKVKAKGWRRNGETFKVGDFHLDAVSDVGIIAGCHRIDWQTVESFAKAQGWIA